MNNAPEEPQLPAPPPEVPKGGLWASLAIPPLLTAAGTFVAGQNYDPSRYGTEFLFVLPVGLLAILICLCFFIVTWRVRYRGISLVLTSIGFLLGQIILCLGLWFGGCVLLTSP